MGGLVAAHAVLRNQERWAGLVLHSAAMNIVWTPLLRAQSLVGGLLAALAPSAQLVPAVKPEDLHPDPKVVGLRGADASAVVAVVISACEEERGLEQDRRPAGVVSQLRMYTDFAPVPLRPLPLHRRQVEAFKSDKLIFKGNLRTRTANEILKGMRAMEPQVPSVRLPLYVMHGMKDLTTSFDAVEDFVKRAASEDVTFVKVEGGWRTGALVSLGGVLG